MTTDELRARVERVVFGATIVPDDHPTSRKQNIIHAGMARHFDTDPRDYMAIEDAMSERGWMISIIRVGFSMPYHVEFRRGARRQSCRDQLGYAIMRAALAALEDGCDPSET